MVVFGLQSQGEGFGFALFQNKSILVLLVGWMGWVFSVCVFFLLLMFV